MPVMEIRVVRVRMPQLCVPVDMDVRLAAVAFDLDRGLVRMLVMLVVPMRVAVLQRFMRVRVLMVFAYVQPDA